MTTTAVSLVTRHSTDLKVRHGSDTACFTLYLGHWSTLMYLYMRDILVDMYIYGLREHILRIAEIRVLKSWN